MQCIEREFLVSQVLSRYQHSHSGSFTFFGATIVCLGDDLSIFLSHRRDQHFTSGMAIQDTAMQFLSVEKKPLFLLAIQQEAKPFEKDRTGDAVERSISRLLWPATEAVERVKWA